MNTDWMASAYEKANDGDWALFAEHLAPNYIHRVPAIGLSFSNREQALESRSQRYAASNIRQDVMSVDQHGAFVIAKVHTTSEIWPQPIDVVHIFRIENEQFVEFLGAYPPPPAS